jgi:hypothetical protein
MPKTNINVDLLEQTADIPIEVALPYFDQIYNQFKITRQNWKAGGKFTKPGSQEMSEVLGIAPKKLSLILNEKKKQVSMEDCDKLQLHGDFSLQEMYDTAKEWAEKHPEANWPIAYDPRKHSGERKGN